MEVGGSCAEAASQLVESDVGTSPNPARAGGSLDQWLKARRAVLLEARHHLGGHMGHPVGDDGEDGEQAFGGGTAADCNPLALCGVLLQGPPIHKAIVVPVDLVAPPLQSDSHLLGPIEVL